MNKMPTQAEQCLKKLQFLKKKINKEMQIHENANFLNKYRLDFQIAQPKNLIGGKLQQHQIEALQWMVNLATQESNGILADDMGLGKTIQAIAYMAYLKEENGIRGKHLVICPKSVSQNWIREINKWFPSAKAVLLLGTQNEREQCLKKIVRPRNFDILVTTYESAKTCFGVLRRIVWEVMVIDEAHKIKNSDTQNFVMLFHYQATFKLLMTGTPLSNNLEELWCLLHFIMPKIFQDPSLFAQIQESAQNFEGTQEEKLNFRVKIAKYFHQIINPYFKRRAKKDLELGLLQKVQKTLFVPLSKMQLQMYKNFLRFGSVYGQGFGQYRHFQLARRICLHPYLFEDMWPEDQQQFGEHAIQNCGKLKVLDKLLKKLLPQKHKVLIFSQFTMLLDVLEDYCEYRQFTYCRLDGNTTLQKREEYMNDFNNTDKYEIFMLSTKAGGLGINLIGADTVIIYDIDWNPQNDIQAMDRAYRIGQTKVVHVYKMITEFTIQERISDFQKYKLVWDQLVIQKGAFMDKKKSEDPFRNFNCQSLVNLGKGDIFRLQVDDSDKTIQQILRLADEKDKKKSDEIKERLKKNFEQANAKVNPFQAEDDQPIPEMSEDEVIFKRKSDIQLSKRQMAKFERLDMIPAFRFYIKAQKIKMLEFQKYIQLKNEQNQQNQRLLHHLDKQLQKIYQHQKFHKWTHRQYRVFLEAHQIYQKHQYQLISSYIQTKTSQEVEQYSKVFFQKAPNNERLSQQLSSINRYQMKLRQFKRKNTVGDSINDYQRQMIKQIQQNRQQKGQEEITQDYENDIRQRSKLTVEEKEQRRLQEKERNEIIKKQAVRLRAEERKKKQLQEREKKKLLHQQQVRRRAEQRRQKQQQQRKQRQLEHKELMQQRAEERKKINDQKREQRRIQQQTLKIEAQKKKAQSLLKENQQSILKMQQRLQQESKRILKKIESESESSKRKSSSSKATERQAPSTNYTDFQANNKGMILQIVVADDISKNQTKRTK